MWKVLSELKLHNHMNPTNRVQKCIGTGIGKTAESRGKRQVLIDKAVAQDLPIYAQLESTRKAYDW